ncbi:MAG: M20 aminoacylase family protein [Planktomarina temperata]|uniref:amidohydrolase n=1 Tax=Planktomarina TaxID=1284657 RepID=UPI0005C74316|nr:M20 family metallopeptidase [Planktomarina temperata]MDA9209253.1 M20 family metallopeptidase [bacterium]MDA7483485.1 M20 family metallopeptidase [Planktomarina temperata]MDA8723147.1 M20 family metallopeptidase [Planktomarina temperata]MDA8785322.1 M20 family metallopeptidase [Planktomarina temperata]
MAILNRFSEMFEEISTWRRDLHAHPELRFEEYRTAAFVASKLKEFGVDEIVTGFGGTGVVGVIHGQNNTSGRSIGFRADMDALPIQEVNDLPHASTIPGKMHACGHDGHTSMLLGAAKYLAETRNFDGKIVLAFQPAEEGGGGARAMIDAGLMDKWNVEEIYGMHNMPGLPIGEFAVRTGPQMACPDKFEIIVHGKGGHGAMPHKSVDSTLVAAQIVVALQSIASRNINPLENIVVSVCGFRTETDTYNVIPNTVRLRGTVRTFEKDVQSFVRARIDALTKSTADGYGAVAEVTHMSGPPPLVNHERQADFAAEIALSVCGVAHRNFEPSMGGEDFSEMLLERPGAYLFVGNGDSADLHNPSYEFNDDVIPVGCSWFVTMAERRMPLS